MTQNIEQRTEVAVKTYEGAASSVNEIAHTDKEVETPAGMRKSFPRISREWDDESKRLQVEWNNDSSTLREDWKNERNELSTKALGVKPWEAGQSENNINQQRRWTDNHTYLPKSVPVVMDVSGPDDNWIPYTADKSDVLSSVFGRKPVELIEGVTLIPDSGQQYPKVSALGKTWELNDSDQQITVKSFTESSNGYLIVTLDNDEQVIAVKVSGASRDWVENKATVSVLSTAIKRTLSDKASDVISVKDFGAVPDEESDTPVDNTDAIQKAIDTAYNLLLKGAEIRFPPGTYRYRRIIPRSNITLSGGAAGSSFLKCIATGEDKPGLGILSSIRKEDDGSRVYRFGMKNLLIGPTDTQVATAEDENQTLIGINLAGCERGNFENLTIMGCGYGAIVLARCEGGTEGLGFNNTVQDGNYNTFKNISLASCGKYNAEQAAIWFKYKANSNKFFGVFSKPVVNTYGIKHGNDNQIFGGTSESSRSIAVFGDMAMGNGFFGCRAEGLSGDGYLFKKGSRLNTVFGGWMTGVSGKNFNYDEAPVQTIMSSGTYYFGGEKFPPDSNVSRDHDAYNLITRALTSLDDEGRVFIKTKDFHNGVPLRLVLWGASSSGVSAEDPGPSVEFWSSDASTSQQPIQAKVQAVYNGSGGGFHLDIYLGGGSNAPLEKVLRIDASQKTLVMPNLPVGNGVPPSKLATGGFWVDSSNDNVVKIK
ncbi:structural protein 2 [Vibrio phage vB_Va_Val-yong3]|nr:structural protein 2 [Vibrio phage vB_Va_Val-yong3]